MKSPETKVATARIIDTPNDTAQRLTGIWQGLLNVSPIGLDQNYFDLGGDSSLAVHLFAEIERVFKVKLPIATLFEAPTIGELAQVLRREAPTFGRSLLDEEGTQTEQRRGLKR